MKQITAPDIMVKKGKEKIAMLTAYDATFAGIIDQAGVDIILVGDSLGMVVQGRPNTIRVDINEMCYHTEIVARATKHAHVVADMPFGSCRHRQAAMDAAVQLVKDGAQSVKVEGGENVVDKIVCIRAEGIPVMGHIGLTPQHIHAFGGFKRQGTTDKEAQVLIETAKHLDYNGVYAMVLECIPEEVAEEITKLVSVPTIGIGSGNKCDGQVLVSYDLFGLSPSTPKFVKPYTDFKTQASIATTLFISNTKKV